VGNEVSTYIVQRYELTCQFPTLSAVAQRYLICGGATNRVTARIFVKTDKNPCAPLARSRELNWSIMFLVIKSVGAEAE
jgi:hypothetical protein